MSTLAVVLTSAGTAALVSGLLSLLGQHLERKSRREELVFERAIDVAISRREAALRVSEETGRGFKLYDDVVVAETYYRWLSGLLDEGELPPEAHEHRP